MSDDEQILRWVDAFKETQRQMSHAHDAYQKALAESHQKYLMAVGESQNRLLHVLEQYGISSAQLEAMQPSADDSTREFKVRSGDNTREFRGRAIAEESIDRVVPAVFPVPQSGTPFSPLVPGARVAILPDQLGVATHVEAMLRSRGFQTRILESSEAATGVDVLIVMCSLQKELSAVQGPLRRALAMIPESPEVSVVVVQDMGGRFGTDFLEPAHAYQAAMQGLADVLRLESARLVKTIDLDVGYRKPEEAAHDLVRELVLGADDLRVGLPEGDRVLWSAIASPLTAQTSTSPQGMLIVTVSDMRWQPLVEALNKGFQGKVVLISNVEIKDGERILCDLTDIEDLTRAIDVARENGPITHWIHLSACDSVESTPADMDRLWDQDIRAFQIVLANTSSDPLTNIGVAVPTPNKLGHVTASVFRALCVAENARREGEARVVAVTADPELGVSYLRSELFAEGVQADVRYIE